MSKRLVIKSEVDEATKRAVEAGKKPPFSLVDLDNELAQIQGEKLAERQRVAEARLRKQGLI